MIKYSFIVFCWSSSFTVSNYNYDHSGISKIERYLASVNKLRSLTFRVVSHTVFFGKNAAVFVEVFHSVFWAKAGSGFKSYGKYRGLNAKCRHHHTARYWTGDAPTSRYLSGTCHLSRPTMINRAWVYGLLHLSCNIFGGYVFSLMNPAHSGGNALENLYSIYHRFMFDLIRV